MTNEQIYTDEAQGYEIKYKMGDRKRYVKYTVRDNAKNHLYELVLWDSGTLYMYMNGQPYVHVSIDMDAGIPRYDGQIHQYVSTRQYFDLTKMNALMQAYEKIKENKFTTFNKNGDYEFNPTVKANQATKILDFMNQYLFYTPESRDVLIAYLTRSRPGDHHRRLETNKKYTQAIQRVLDNEKNKTDIQKPKSWFRRLITNNGVEK